jgi:hypothetical protein
MDRLDVWRPERGTIDTCSFDAAPSDAGIDLSLDAVTLTA